MKDIMTEINFQFIHSFKDIFLYLENCFESICNAFKKIAWKFDTCFWVLKILKFYFVRGNRLLVFEGNISLESWISPREQNYVHESTLDVDLDMVRGSIISFQWVST